MTQPSRAYGAFQFMAPRKSGKTEFMAQMAALGRTAHKAGMSVAEVAEAFVLFGRPTGPPTEPLGPFIKKCYLVRPGVVYRERHTRIDGIATIPSTALVQVVRLTHDDAFYVDRRVSARELMMKYQVDPRRCIVQTEEEQRRHGDHQQWPESQPSIYTNEPLPPVSDVKVITVSDLIVLAPDPTEAYALPAPENERQSERVLDPAPNRFIIAEQHKSDIPPNILDFDLDPYA